MPGVARLVEQFLFEARRRVVCKAKPSVSYAQRRKATRICVEKMRGAVRRGGRRCLPKRAPQLPILKVFFAHLATQTCRYNELRYLNIEYLYY